MISLLRLPSLMLIFAVASLADLPAHGARIAAPTFSSHLSSGLQGLAHPSGQPSRTLAFYIPRPPRGPQA